MGTYFTQVWRSDREIEAFYAKPPPPPSRGTHIFELTHGRMPTADEFLEIIEDMSAELEALHQHFHDDHFVLERLCESMGKPMEWMHVPAEIDRLREQSKNRALRLRAQLGLKEDPATVDGFAKIRGLLKKYVSESEDPVEFLRKAREEE